MSDIIAYGVAVIIPIMVIYTIYKMDLFGTGKFPSVGLCVAWGAIFAVGGAYFINTAAAQSLSDDTVRTLTAPIAEEILKGIILIILIQRPTFRYFVDGAVYGFAVGMGFAISENLFFVVNDTDGEVLSLVVKRVLSSSLMHGFASGIFGISLGLTRRVSGPLQRALPMLGLGGAILIHMIYNNIVVRLEGTDLLLVAFSIGLGGSAVIAYLISWGLREEKEHFNQALRLSTGISGAELRAVQRLGGMEVEGILQELATYFGADKAGRIRHLLIQEANLGILRNNLNGNASERLRKAWSAEIDTLHAEIDTIRDELGVYVMMYLRSLLPNAESIEWADVGERFATSAPEKVHSFDLFMVASKMAQTVSPEQMEATSTMLGKIKIFAGVPPTDLDNLSRAISARNFETGEALFKQGDAGDAMYLIEEGHIEIVDDIAGKRLRTMSIGEVVGLLTIIDGLPRSASARALVPVKAWQLRRQHFLMFVQSRPHVSLAMLRVLADEWRDANERMLREVSGSSPEDTMTRIGSALKMLGSIADHDLQTRASREISAESLGTG